jgi:hypothetical protein
MSSGKPQTRGLAALLRIEKERREREEAGAEESAAPEGVDERPAPLGVVAPARAPQPAAEKVAAPQDSGGESAASPPEEAAVIRVEGSVPTSAAADTAEPLADASQAAAAPAAGEEGRRKAAAPFPAPAPPPLQRRPPTQPAGASRKDAGAQTEAPQALDPGWEKFVADWKPFLRQGIKFKLCEFFYRNTVAAGRREFITSTAQLSRVSGAHRRHIFLVLRQLEELRFIKKESVETNRKDEGLVIRFFPDRQA